MWYCMILCGSALICMVWYWLACRHFLQVRIHFEPQNVRYLRALVWPQYPHPENWPRLHNPLGLSWGLKSSSTGPQLGAKTPETAMTKLTQMVQSPPHTFWYVFYVSDIGSVENCWTTRNDANWSRTLARYFFKSYEITTDRLSDTSRPRIFCLNVYDCKKE